MRMTKVSYEVNGTEITIKPIGMGRIEFCTGCRVYNRSVESDEECDSVAALILARVFGTRGKDYTPDVDSSEIAALSKILRDLP